jgi:hypothetical protein
LKEREGMKMAKYESRYQEMAVSYLKAKNPEELKRLESEGKLSEFLEDVRELYEDQEATIYQQMTRDLPSKQLPRMQRINQAKSVAQEVTAKDLTEFLAGLEITE